MATPQIPAANPIKHQARPRGIYRFFPILTTLRNYRRDWILQDISAGLVLTAILVPVGMGYAAYVQMHRLNVAAGQRLVRGVIEHAHARGMDGERDGEFFAHLGRGAWLFDFSYGDHRKDERQRETQRRATGPTDTGHRSRADHGRIPAEPGRPLA